MTERLFDKDSYIKEFDGKCINCTEKDGKFLVELDKTCFFPEGGGQKGDRGKLNGTDVVDTQIKDGIIYHICTMEIKAGETVHGEIFWEERYSKMQNHSAEHIVSGIVNKNFGFDNVGFRLADDFVTMDYNGILSEKDVDFIEKEANKVSNANLHIKTYYPDNAENLIYRSKIDIKENLRIVEIPGVDICACCAPHVKQTGETGMIKIIRREKNKGGTRLTMKSGNFALKDMCDSKKTLGEISEMLSLPEKDVSEGVARLLEKIQKLEEEKKEFVLSRVLTQAKNSTAPYVFIDSADFLKEAVNLLKERFSGNVGAFSMNENGCRFMILSESAEDVAKIMKSKLDCSGGGRNGMVQGNIRADRDTIENVLKKHIFI